MIRIIDRYYPDAAIPNVLTSKNDLLFKQPALDPNKMLTKSNSLPSGKATDNTLIEVPKKWDFFQVHLNSPSSYSWANNLLHSSSSLESYLHSTCLLILNVN
jgi:hypothetical protein